MANIKSQVKRNKQNVKRWMNNSRLKASIRTMSKNVLRAIEAKGNPESLKKLYDKFTSSIDKAAGKRIIHKKTAARKKSRLAKRIKTAVQGRS